MRAASLLPIAVVGFVAASVGIERLSNPPEVTIATFASPLEGRLQSQRHNAQLSLLKLDGVKIEPHDSFSFNRTVGSWGRDTGYKKAPVSYNGQLVDGWGGGVCQTSTTLYNAALLAGLVILERTRHQFAASYVPPGRDAAVAYQNIDLRFANPYDFPITIRAGIENDRAVVRIMGRRPPEPISVRQEVTRISEPQEYILRGRASRNHLRTAGKPGFDVAVYRQIGNRRQLVSRDSYPVMNRIVEAP